MIIIVNYGVGNLGSIKNMLRKAGVEAGISSEVSEIASADKLILPGVGAFDTGMSSLESARLRPVLDRAVLEKRVPVLGICLGMQLFMESSEEGRMPGLGWIKGRTVRFNFASRGHDLLQIPHMGWNNLKVTKSSVMLDRIGEDARFYFVHSYHVDCDSAYISATTEYGYRFPAVICCDNITGVQFHPEKSHRYGLALLRAFAKGAEC